MADQYAQFKGLRDVWAGKVTVSVPSIAAGAVGNADVFVPTPIKGYEVVASPAQQMDGHAVLAGVANTGEGVIRFFFSNPSAGASTAGDIDFAFFAWKP